MAAGAAETERILGARKRRLFAGVAGDVLELGPGAGANLAALADVAKGSLRWVGVEPNPAMHPPLHARAAELGLPVSLRDLDGARLPAADASVDHVISTLVLCSVPDVAETLAEIQRVLRPGGSFRFIEHVGATPGVRRCLQELVVYTPWTYLSDGCDPRRDLAGAIEAAGFASLRLERFDPPGDGLAKALTRPHISGVATVDG